jgi:hypothetical protein
LLEFVSLAILLSVGLTAVGGVIGGILYSQGSPGISNTSSWLAIEFGSRWVNPPITGLLLAELAVCWLSYGQWAGTSQDAGPEMIAIHVRRLNRLIGLTQLAFGVVLLAALASAISLIAVDHMAFTGEPGAQVWGADIYGIFSALGVIVLTSVGSFAARRLQRATSHFDPHTSGDTVPSPTD